MLPEVFADAALDAIACHSTAGDAYADCKPQAWMRKTVKSRTHEKECVG